MKVDLYDLWTLELYFLVANSKVELIRDKLVTSVKNNFINAAKLSHQLPHSIDSGQNVEIEKNIELNGTKKLELGTISGWDSGRHSLLNIIKHSYCSYIQESFETETKLKLNANNDDLERSHLIFMEKLKNSGLSKMQNKTNANDSSTVNDLSSK
jgi:hypothetical protein